MSRLVKTPAGKGRIVGAAQTNEGWRVQVGLASGGTWTGPAKQLSGAHAEKALEEFRRELGEEVAD